MSTAPETTLAPPVVCTLLPGPTRKRTRAPYHYRLTYQSPAPTEPGCALLWEVEGGRTPYQIALEREESGGLRYHCTCPDAIYRGEDAPHVCKHVRGIIALGLRSAVRFPLDPPAEAASICAE